MDSITTAEGRTWFEPGMELLEVEADPDLEPPEFDRLPGMPLLGFVAGTVLSAALWIVLGLVTWTLLA